MPSLIQPLQRNMPIADPKTGNPTPYFIQVLQKLAVASGLIAKNGQISIGNGSVTNAMLANMAAGLIKGNKETVAGVPEDLTLSQVLDLIGGATWGDILFRGTAGWRRLPAGTAGQFLKTNGAAADPVWSASGGAGGTPTIRASGIGSYNAASVVIPWPAGTVVGDVVLIYWENGYPITAVPAGWTPIHLGASSGNYTNQGCAAKIMTAADIAAGSVNVTAGGGFNGIWAALTMTGSTVTGIDHLDYFDSLGSVSYTSAPITGMFGVSSSDLLFGFLSTRGTMNVTVSSGLTILQTVNSPSASGILFQIGGGAMTKLGINELATLPVANNGVAWTTLAFK